MNEKTSFIGSPARASGSVPEDLSRALALRVTAHAISAISKRHPPNTGELPVLLSRTGRQTANAVRDASTRHVHMCRSPANLVLRGDRKAVELQAAAAVGLSAPAQSASALRSGVDRAPPIPDLRGVNIDPQAALNLADRLQAGSEAGSPQPTLASDARHARAAIMTRTPKT